MKNFFFFSYIIVFAFFISCKKDDTTPSDTTSEVTKHIDGYLKNNLIQKINGKTLEFVNALSYAYFYSSDSTNNLVSMDSVMLNGKKMKVRSDSLYYSSEPLLAINSWHIEGKNGFDKFDTALTLPAFANYTDILDSIDLKQDFIISLTGITNATSGSITLTDVLGKNFSRDYTTGDTFVVFTSNELATFNKYGSFFLNINLKNDQEDQMVKGKKFTFSTEYSVSKYIKPY